MSGRQNNSSAKPPNTGWFKRLVLRFSQYIPSRATRATRATRARSKVEPRNSPQLPSLPQLPPSRLSKLKPLPPKPPDDLDLRINRYDLIQETLKELNKNDQNKLTKYACLQKNYDNTYYIKDIITLDERIGSQSENGAIYKTVIKGNHINIATKVMESSNGNKLETKLMKAITEQIIMTKKSKHFVIMYCYSLCKELERKEANYALVNFNELAKNDLEILLQQKKILEDEELLYNILLQAIISIGTFHNFTGYIHSDCHLKNFLYIDNTENNRGDMMRYYQYSFDGKKYYLKSSKYNLMIYDFGFSTDTGMDDENLIYHILGTYIIIKRNETGEEYTDEEIISLIYDIKVNLKDHKAKLIIEDYLRLLYNLHNISDIHSDIFTKINNIINNLEKIKFKNANDLLKQILEAVLNICINEFKKINIFTDKLPEGGIIINAQPFEFYRKTKLDIALPDI